MHNHEIATLDGAIKYPMDDQALDPTPAAKSIHDTTKPSPMAEVTQVLLEISSSLKTFGRVMMEIRDNTRELISVTRNSSSEQVKDRTNEQFPKLNDLTMKTSDMVTIFAKAQHSAS